MVDDRRQQGSEPRIGSDDSPRRVPGEEGNEPAEGRIPVDDLIIKVLARAASPFEEERLRRWRASEAGNEHRYREIAQVWELTAPEPGPSASNPPAVDTILAAADREQGAETLALPRRGRRPPWRALGLLAASVAAVSLGIGTILGGPDPLAEYAATASDPVTVTLADGSFVRLAPEATLQEWEAPGGREVSVEGRAFFAVARDETRPFTVRTAAGTVRVLGTRFQVLTEGDRLEAAVVEGLVQVANEHGSVEVPAGAVSTMTPDTGPSLTQVDYVLAMLDWPGGVLVFQATPLEQVVEEVGRHYGREIRIVDLDLPQRRVTAWFQGEPFEAVAESLCLVTEAVCRTEGAHMVMGTDGGGQSR
jgi:transmembrane sensor